MKQIPWLIPFALAGAALAQTEGSFHLTEYFGAAWPETALAYPPNDFATHFSSTGAAAASTHYESTYLQPLILNCGSLGAAGNLMWGSRQQNSATRITEGAQPVTTIARKKANTRPGNGHPFMAHGPVAEPSE